LELGTKRLIQIFLLLALVLAAARMYFIFRGRQGTQWKQQQAEKNGTLDPDYYVTPKKLYAQNLKQAKNLTKQPVWVREGYKYTFYPYTGGHVDFRHAAGLLGPIEKLAITDVVVEKSPQERDKQVMAVFEKGGKKFAFPLGVLEGKENYQIYADEILYLQDPHELYKHWKPELWQTIEAHEVKPGMNELQASFAVGAGSLESGSRTDQRVIRYANGGNPLLVTYKDGKAVEVKPVPPDQSGLRETQNDSRREGLTSMAWAGTSQSAEIPACPDM
jgi:hypothetical protein